VGGLVEDGHLEGHALALGGVQDALDRRMDAVGGHGPESSIDRASDRAPGPEVASLAWTP
jgi:hypothetical protein